MEREMCEDESSLSAAMEQVEINSDDKVPDEVIAAFMRSGSANNSKAQCASSRRVASTTTRSL